MRPPLEDGSPSACRPHASWEEALSAQHDARTDHKLLRVDIEYFCSELAAVPTLASGETVASSGKPQQSPTHSLLHAEFMRCESR